MTKTSVITGRSGLHVGRLEDDVVGGRGRVGLSWRAGPSLFERDRLQCGGGVLVRRHWHRPRL